MPERTFADELATLRQQVRALASICGVLLAALRQGGLLGRELEDLLSAEMVDAAAAAASPQVRQDWAVVFAAVQKVSAATARTVGETGPAA